MNRCKVIKKKIHYSSLQPIICTSRVLQSIAVVIELHSTRNNFDYAPNKCIHFFVSTVYICTILLIYYCGKDCQWHPSVHLSLHPQYSIPQEAYDIREQIVFPRIFSSQGYMTNFQPTNCQKCRVQFPEGVFKGRGMQFFPSFSFLLSTIECGQDDLTMSNSLG